LKSGLIVFIIIHFTLGIAYGQINEKTVFGSAKGIVRDSVNNYALKFATVSISTEKTAALVSYQITDSYGGFSFRKLPLNTAFILRISNVGYKTFVGRFELTAKDSVSDFRTIFLEPGIMLNEVKVTLPPVSMKGDTLEFNASAFKLDSNAVVEDLLRSIPNVTVWGDGQITVNGQEVKSLLVNGKNFFGGDFKIATQNIPKDIVNKIQVYKTAETDRQDSSLVVDLKLKKGKENGLFGKIEAGFGTSKRYDLDASLNFFSPKMQIGVVGATNNVNKIANDVNTLISNSSFKGTGISLQYQSDFSQAGTIKEKTGGATFTYNFIEKPRSDNKNELRIDYFLQDRNSTERINTQTITTVGDNDQLFSNNDYQVNSLRQKKELTSRYELSKNDNDLVINAVGSNEKINVGTNTDQATRNTEHILTSTNSLSQNQELENKGVDIKADYSHIPKSTGFNEFNFGGIKLNYSTNIKNQNGDNRSSSSFRSFADSSQNVGYNRLYNINNTIASQSLYLELPNIQGLLGSHSRLNLSIISNLELSSDKNRSKVFDFDSKNDTQLLNNYLTNQSKENISKVVPGLRLSSDIKKTLANRFYSTLTPSVAIRQRLAFQDIQSDKDFQKISRSYNNIYGEAAIDYNKTKIGTFNENAAFFIGNEYIVPTLNQLVPLTDSINQYSLLRGNRNLKESVKRFLKFNYGRSYSDGRNFSFILGVDIGNIQNDIVDSIYIDKQNRSSIYYANAISKYLFFEGTVRKSHKFNFGDLQLKFSGSQSFKNSLNYLNGFSGNTNYSFSKALLSLNYSFKGEILMEISEGINAYKVSQPSFGLDFSGTNRSTSFNISYQVSKGLTVNSNVILYNNSASNSQSINYSIWDASVNYRFTKSKAFEVKLAALDLLRQNRSVLNYSNINSYTIGTINSLRQYFMTTLAFYPRRFGK
jgi:hypothetical protein